MGDNNKKKKKLYSAQSNQKQRYLTRQPDPLTQFVIMQIQSCTFSREMWKLMI